MVTGGENTFRYTDKLVYLFFSLNSTFTRASYFKVTENIGKKLVKDDQVTKGNWKIF